MSERLPAWLRVGLPSGDNWRRIADILERRGLATVCDSARCPNKAECWGAATATFMVLGSVCTRGCRFCAVTHRREGEPLRPEEPQELARAVGHLPNSDVLLGGMPVFDPQEESMLRQVEAVRLAGEWGAQLSDEISRRFFAHAVERHFAS